jgi:hypothetical protein
LSSLCGLGVAALLTAAVVAPVAPASADPVSSLQAQAAQLARQMLLEQLQIQGFEQQRAADLAAVSADEAQLAATQSQIAQTRAKVAKDRATLATAAVKAYMEGGTQAAGTAPLFAADPTQSASAVYDQVMTGNLTVAVDRLQTDRKALQVEQNTEQQFIASAQTMAARASAALASAQSTAQTLASQHAVVTGELAAAVAQVQAQQAAAARAAAAQAAAAAARSAPQVMATSSGTPPLPTLPPFLRCVIQVESGGDYRAISPTGQYMGAFQFAQGTWNYAAQLAGKPTLIGVPPYKASPYDQDLLAIALYNAVGEQPWYDPCRG